MADETLQLFLSEAREYLQAAGQALLALERQPDDRESVDTLFRALHSIKGMAGTLGFQQTASLAHRIEDVLASIREGVLRPGGEMIDDLLRGLDRVNELLEGIEAWGTEAPPGNDEVLAALERWTSRAGPDHGPGRSTGAAHTPGGPPGAPVHLDEAVLHELSQALAEGLAVYRVQVELDPGCVMKGARAYLVLREAAELGRVLATAPPVEALENEEFESEFTLVVAARPGSGLEARLAAVAEVRRVEVTLWRPPLDPAPAPAAFPPPAPAPAAPGGPPPARGEGSVRVETSRLDELVNLVGELVIARTRALEVLQPGGREEQAALEQLDRITTQLQHAALALRMVPVKVLFDRFPRVVRDIARTLDKRVELVVSGQETELDRNLVNLLADPLVHLLRNAVDHGIEAPGERQRLGKPEAGTIWLTARHEGNQVLIEVRDDGRGMDPAALRRRAVEKGFLPEAAAAALSDREALELIFRPGFSTAPQVTGLSGRGVGMDAVRGAVTALGGRVEVWSRVGQGSAFLLRLPLTLAIVPALLCRVQQEIFALPVALVQEGLRLEPGGVNHVGGTAVVRWRDRLVPLASLHHWLGEGEAAPASPLPGRYVVVVAGEERLVGLVVDEIVGQQEVVVKSLGRLLAGIPGVGGATLLGSGRVALILDPGYWLGAGRNGGAGPEQGGESDGSAGSCS